MIRWRTPRWWYRRGRPPLLACALIPLSRVWASRTAARIRRVVPSNPGAPVICVGNLTAGGSGKTPCAMEIARLLREAGGRPVILASGYGGRLRGATLVSDHHTAADVGDEALLLKRAAPVVVSRDRLAGARLAVATGADVVVMDDGHQNPALAKTLSIVVVDGETRNGEWPFGSGAVIPAGPLRESLAAGLARADAVVVLLPADLATADANLLAMLGNKPIWTAKWEPSTPFHRHPARNEARRSVDAGPSGACPEGAQLGSGSSVAALPPSGTTAQVGGPKVLGFAGVAKPWRVARTLRAAGFEVVSFEAFPDHAPIRDAALRRLWARAKKAGASLITTEKDWVRLSPEWRERVAFWPVRIVFDDEAAVSAALRSAWRA